MGIVEKLKVGAEQAKTLAVHAAERARDEAKDLNLKRQISNEESQLGSIVVQLVERGEISHAELGPGVERVKALHAELEARQSAKPDESSDEAPAEPGQPPAAGLTPPESNDGH
jgi:hypothetical protein